MKIVYLIAGTFNSGGMERVMTNKANWLVRHGHEVAVVTTDQRGREPYFTLDERIQTCDLDINYDADNGCLLSKLVNYPLRQWRHRRRLTSLLLRLKADIVICMFNNDVSFVYKIHDGSRKVLEAHFSKNKKLLYGRRDLWALADRWRTRREERIVRHYNHFVVLTHEDAALWGNLPNSCVIPNARTFTPERPSSLTYRHVLAIGRYEYQKGFDRLLRIWKHVADKGPWMLDIIGDGPLRPALQEQLLQLGLQDSVRLLQPTNNIQDAYLHASVFVMTSHYEGLPMVLLEAQACGLPIVSFACQCGPRDIIHDGTDGYLIEGEEEELFAQRLSALMHDEALRQSMGKVALANSSRYSEYLIMKRWEALFSITA